MLTRGRRANHLYLKVVGDGDPHTLIRPDTISPRTPTETLQQILARDEAPVSASTLLRELNDPAARFFQAVQRYCDVEAVVGPQAVAELDQADQYIPGLTAEPAWPTLRAHLLTLGAETGKRPLRHMLTAAAGHEVGTADDMAAVLYWRLPELTPIGRRGDLTVRHNRSQLTVRLPADYVRTSTGLGYATTIHATQGVSADTMHGLLTGQESRQQGEKRRPLDHHWGDDHVPDTRAVSVPDTHFLPDRYAVEAMLTGSAVELSDELAGGGEHDRVQSDGSVGNPSNKRILGGFGEVADMDPAVIKVEPE
jgi:hypothetical protein